MTNTADLQDAALVCGICDKRFWPYEGMRKPATYGAPYWCKADQEEFDSIDRDEAGGAR